MRGKSGNFRGIHSSKWQKRRKIMRSFSVVSGHSWLWFRMIPRNHSF
uniref:Uncharacterized protein n=1 Tax=Siphoviridae sp. ctETl1 TaxID=2826207 RepID=A0A8S5QT99_9CAUD|nr:MAG TPA: hypothetical protein [Siphoviridae sp. ctETl1]